MADCTTGWALNTAVTAQQSWYNTAITVTGSTTSVIWNSWITNSATTAQNYVFAQWAGQVEARKETKREAAARRKREREHAAQFAERQRKAVEAQARAEALLVEHLSPEQAMTLAARNYFDVAIGERKYRIHRGTHGNVRLLDETGREKTLFCVQPEGVPVPDAMLAQKLHLEANEQEFLRVANARVLL
jgi:hypothetical protein